MKKVTVEIEIDESLLSSALAKSKNEAMSLDELIDKALRTEIFEKNFEEKRKLRLPE